MPRYLRLLAIVVILSLAWVDRLEASQAPPDRAERYIPAFEVWQAYRAFLGVGRAADREKARADLLLFSLRESSTFLARNRVHAVDQGWRRGFLQTFDQAVAFAERVKAGSPAEILALSRAVRAADQLPNHELADAILEWATNRRHYEADFEWAQRLLDGPEFGHDWGRMIINHLAWLRLPYALADIARRYREGDGFERNLQKAYYWALVSRRAGLAIDDQIAALAAELPQPAIIEAERWVEAGTVVDP